MKTTTANSNSKTSEITKNVEKSTKIRNKVAKTKKIQMTDCRHMSFKDQLTQRINVLCDLLVVTKTPTIEMLHATRIKHSDLLSIANIYKTSVEKIYRWIREYDSNHGITIKLRGRTKIAA